MNKVKKTKKKQRLIYVFNGARFTRVKVQRARAAP